MFELESDELKRQQAGTKQTRWNSTSNVVDHKESQESTPKQAAEPDPKYKQFRKRALLNRRPEDFYEYHQDH